MHMTNLSRVDLNLLVVLDAIVAEGGVSRAAERLNLTQPAVSHALARLRELFDDPLFVREGRSLAPTSLTKRLIEPLRQSLLALGTLIEKGESFDPARTETTFTVSMRDPMEVLILPALDEAPGPRSTGDRPAHGAGSPPRHRERPGRRHARCRVRCRLAACRSGSIASA